MAEIVVGMDMLQKQLQDLEFSLQRKVLIEVTNAGAEIVRQAAIQLAPRDTGALAKGMRKRVIGRESDIHEATVEVGWGKKQFYGGFVERGTKNMSAQPYLKPALENNRARILEVMEETIRKAIEKAVK